MAKVQHYNQNVLRNKICNKGDHHQGQPINLVCLDSLCRNSPLACATCYTDIHKHHKISALNKFINDYKSNIGQIDSKSQQRKINMHYEQMKNLVKKFKAKVLAKIQDFQTSLDEYASYLSGHSYVRDEVGRQLRIQLDPDRIITINNRDDLENSIKFILNNCLYDSNTNMINVSDILKQDQERVSALLDRMVYMTQFCEKTIDKSFKNFDFIKQTLRQQKKMMNIQIRQLNNVTSNPFNTKQFVTKKSKLSRIIQLKGSLILTDSQSIQQMNKNLQEFAVQGNSLNTLISNFKFGKHKNQKIQIQNQGNTAMSNITASNAHYALAWPNLNTQPQSIKQWSIKINKCRDFASKNTMALGIGRLSDMKLARFEGAPTNTLLVSSQGYVVLNGKIEQTDFVYGEGDVVHFSYDPYYRILQVFKENGRRLCLQTMKTSDDEPLYVCARLTYASDQVQLI